MPLTSFISLSSTNGYYYGYDASNPDAPYGYGNLASYGGHAYNDQSGIDEQAAQDETLLRFAPAAPTDLSLNDMASDVYSKSCVRMYLRGYNTTTENQFLVVMGLRQYGGSVTAQIFVNSDLVREEPLSGSEQVAILTDDPGTGFYVYVRVASDDYWAGMYFEGAEVYLL